MLLVLGVSSQKKWARLKVSAGTRTELYKRNRRVQGRRGREDRETNEYQEEEIQTTFKRNVRFMGGIEKCDACSSSVLSLEAQQVPSGRLLPHSSALETS